MRTSLDVTGTAETDLLAAESAGWSQSDAAVDGLLSQLRSVDFSPHLRLARACADAQHAEIVFFHSRDLVAEPTPRGYGGSRAIDLARQAAASGEVLALPETDADDAAAFLAMPIALRGGAMCACLYLTRGVPGPWTGAQRVALESLAAALRGELVLRLETAERRALENLVRMLGTAVENMQLGVTITDPNGRIDYTNPAEAQMHGFTVAELVGEHARVLGPPELCRAMDPADVLQASSWTRESVNVRRDGSRFPVLLWSDMVRDADGRCIGFVTCSEDITERKHAEQALREYALRDALTGLPNRVHFLDRLTDAIRRGRNDPDFHFGILFLDLDRFKVVNDSLGHHVGDELLGVIASRLSACVRPLDTVARFGGDEFALLLEGIDGVDDATRVAQRVLESLGTPIILDGYELFTSASIGIVMGSPGIDQPEYLWRSADMAMYRAKAAGTGRFEIFDRAMHADALARLQLETDLRRALDNDEFELHYQPVIDLRDGSVIGFEALLRWLHPLQGMVFPTEVIRVAEETGLIHRLGEWVFFEACRQLRRWRDEGGDEVVPWVGVNLSSKQLSQPDLVERVCAALEESGVPPHTLKLEITESAVVENSEDAVERLRLLRAVGIQLYMDDFGTGYSSLSYLHRLPLDALKIDRSFISEMVRGDKHSRLVETILQLARSANLRVVAEGVSTPDQLALLRELECDYAQGYLFSHAIPASEVKEYLRKVKKWR